MRQNVQSALLVVVLIMGALEVSSSWLAGLQVQCSYTKGSKIMGKGKITRKNLGSGRKIRLRLPE